ncbi:hypothetical protein [Gracilibacillus kekensis]|uniref:Uncharacterized protein n=1 Tax=Gracilibacillus kekensis TaxID=1027249 RepID=A0A1M7J494_9BACI|nr:hypothetical protein [Gracilibacillus kekensis]SHM47816.1 hypothetical protein SAMN05216179_0246 [Gracilibacillus kekensis]
MGIEMFIYLRPIFITMIILLLILFLVILIQHKLLTTFSVLAFAISFIILANVTLYMSGEIVDELNLTRDQNEFYYVIAIVVLSFINVVVFRYKKRKEGRIFY